MNSSDIFPIKIPDNFDCSLEPTMTSEGASPTIPKVVRSVMGDNAIRGRTQPPAPNPVGIGQQPTGGPSATRGVLATAGTQVELPVQNARFDAAVP